MFDLFAKQSINSPIHSIKQFTNVMIMQFHTRPLMRSSHKVEDKVYRLIEVFVIHPELVPMYGQRWRTQETTVDFIVTTRNVTNCRVVKHGSLQLHQRKHANKGNRPWKRGGRRDKHVRPETPRCGGCCDTGRTHGEG